MPRESPDPSRPRPSKRDYLDILGMFLLAMCGAVALGFLYSYLTRLMGYRLYYAGAPEKGTLFGPRWGLIRERL